MPNRLLSTMPTTSLTPTATLQRAARRRLIGLLAAAPLLALPGCGSAPVPQDYAKETPAFSLRDYFNGPLTAHGLFTDRSGRVIKRFQVAMVGRWDGAQGVLEEDFTYSDGSKQRRVWRLRDLGNGRWEGRADDVVGVAQGEVAGNALNWHYTLSLPVDDRVWEVQFDDWMYQMDAHTVLNKARMSKWGFTLGEVTLSFHKP
jgi:hypothetical protein